MSYGNSYEVIPRGEAAIPAGYFDGDIEEMGKPPARFKRLAEKYFAEAYPPSFAFVISILLRMRRIATAQDTSERDALNVCREEKFWFEQQGLGEVKIFCRSSVSTAGNTATSNRQSMRCSDHSNSGHGLSGKWARNNGPDTRAAFPLLTPCSRASGGALNKGRSSGTKA